MSTNQQTGQPGWDVEIPAGWTVIDPPDGLALVAVDPGDDADDTSFRPNLVVTYQDRSDGRRDVEPDVEHVNEYLDTLLDALETSLPEATVLGVWTAGASADAPAVLATQRVLVGYRTPDGDEVDMMQQHVWLGGEIVTATATVPADAEQAMIDTLNACLESITPTA